MPHFVLIAGSPVEASRTTATLETLQRWLSARGATATLIVVRDLPAEALLTADTHHPLIEGAVDAISGADGVIVATPIYKGAYSGILKAFLDLLPQGAFDEKVALPIVTGGSIANLLAVDYVLKPLLGALGARNIRAGVFLTDDQLTRSTTGVRFEESAVRLLHEATADLLRQFPPDLALTPAKFGGSEVFW